MKKKQKRAQRDEMKFIEKLSFIIWAIAAALVGLISFFTVAKITLGR